MEKVWLQSYPANVSSDIDMSTYASLLEVFDGVFDKFADRPALTSMGYTISYREFDTYTRAFAAYLQNQLGLAPGTRIAVMIPNIIQSPIAIVGALRAGMVVVNTNPLYTARELRHQLQDSEAEAIVILDNFAATLQEVIASTSVRHVIMTSLGDMLPFPKSLLVNAVVKYVKRMVPAYRLPDSIPFKRVLAQGDPEAMKLVEVQQHDLAFLQYTGGTTGVAKGAMLSHGNMIANLLQARAWVASSGRVVEGEEVIVTALPLYHIFALTANLLTFMAFGANSVMIVNPRDLPAFVKALDGVQFTAITGVNTLFNALLNTPGFSELDFSKMHCALGGGMAVQRSVAEAWQQVTGETLIEAYGLTETSPAACINPLNLAAYNGSIGLPLPSTECVVRDPLGYALPTQEEGELCIRGPQVMQGYWKRPEETAKVIDEEGWLRTGDVARIDEKGFVYLVDRLKDMINVSGFNVYPNEIEDVASMHPSVLEVGAVGVPDEHSGEVVKLVVVRKDEQLEADELIAHCRRYLTGYKVPKLIEFVDELPKTNVGKILRRELR